MDIKNIHLKKLNVFVVCTGLGHVNRGYESFTNECYQAIKNNDHFECYLLKGAGKTSANEVNIACFRRDSKMAILLARLVKQNSYWVEQFTFLIGMLPLIIKRKPAVIYYSDFILGTFLWHLRRVFKFKYKLLFANGAPNGPPFITEDHVQQILPVYFDDALKKGVPISKLTLLPYGFNINMAQKLNDITKKSETREKFGFSADKILVLSVGAVNSSHKRMHYLINEVAKLPEKYFLIILGQIEDESPPIIRLANDKLPGRSIIASVPYEKVQDYYIIADHFVLPSLREGFGRVLIEAASCGLQCVVNDNINARQVLGENGIYINMEQENALYENLLQAQKALDKKVLIETVYNKYSWDKLRDKYFDMILKVMN